MSHNANTLSESTQYFHSDVLLVERAAVESEQQGL